MEITARLVKELRERTGVGMMECKKALVQCDGDIDVAIEFMRKSGMAKAASKASRVAAEGLIAIERTTEGRSAAMVEVNSETDFVAKGDDFKAFATAVARCVLANTPSDVDALMNLPLDVQGDETVEEHRRQLVAKVGENISVRRFTLFSGADVLGVYRHGQKIGVLVDLSGGNERLARDIAMHVAASRPICVAEPDVPAETLSKEREILMAQAEQSGKPPEIVEKMVSGRLKKFLSEITLVGQSFIRDPELTVGELLSEGRAKVEAFTRFEVGEGIEKKVENFAEEVMAQAKGA